VEVEYVDVGGEGSREERSVASLCAAQRALFDVCVCGSGEGGEGRIKRFLSQTSDILCALRALLCYVCGGDVAAKRSEMLDLKDLELAPAVERW
jgi:hypothetical protein